MTSYKQHDELLDYACSQMQTGSGRPALDLACGAGRSGLHLARRNIPVVFADKSTNALDEVTTSLSQNNLAGRLWQVDLEREGVQPFETEVFSMVVCFRYLHRPLIPALLSAVEPDGLIVYETFTTDNLLFGRPGNPDFLFEPDELESWFKDWQVLHYYEGIQTVPDRAIAQIVARNRPPA